MFFVLYGADSMRLAEEKSTILKKYRSDDDFNLAEFSDQVDVASLSASMKQAPMFADYFICVVHFNKRQFLQFRDYLTPSDFTVLVLICTDFLYSEDLFKGLKVDSVVDCRPRGFREQVKWIKSCANEFGFSMELEDRKKLALMFQNSKELKDVLFQMSLLEPFERREFFNDLFKTKQEFVWNLFIALINCEKKAFFSKYAEQFRLNVELSHSQFNMKIVGGLLFCLDHWEDAPDWIQAKLKTMNENGEALTPFLYSHLTETLVIARKEQSNIPVLMRFVSIMKEAEKL